MGGAGGLSGGGRKEQGGQQISEAAYVRLWEQYCQMMGRPFSSETVRGWFRDYQSRLTGGQG